MAIGPGIELLDRRYLVQEEIGRGGFGVVWKGQDRRLPRPVAIKVLFGQGEDSQWAQRFYQEARVAAGLDNSVTPEVYDFDQLDGEYFIVMEYLDGHDLAKELREHPQGLPLSRVLRLGAEAAEALEKAHRRQIVHRDLKPSNLFVPAGDGPLKILDFGIAKIPDVKLTASGGFIGTPAYMAPEMFGTGPVDIRADLFSLGRVLYEMVTGQLPNRVEEPAVIRQRIAAAAGRRSAGGPLGDLIAGLLAREPADRPRSARDVAVALRGMAPEGGRPGAAGRGRAAPALAGGGTRSFGPGQFPDPSTTPRLRAGGVNRAAIAVGAVGVVAVLATWLITSATASGSPRPAVTITKNVTVAPVAASAPAGAYVGSIAAGTDAHATISMNIDGSDYFLQMPEQDGEIQLQPQQLNGTSIPATQAQVGTNDGPPSSNETWHIGVCTGNPDPNGDAFIGTANQPITGNTTADPITLLEALGNGSGTQAYLAAAPDFLCGTPQASSWAFIPQGNGYWIVNDNNCLTASVGVGQGNNAVLESCSSAANSDQVWTITQSSK